jgi:hypothetical protein
MANAKYLAAACLVVCAASSHAQHLDVLAYNNSGKVAVGQYDFDNLQTTARTVFTAQLPSTYADNDPGFSANPGPQALPARQDLMWDFLPFRAGDYLGTLLYWDGVGPTPKFELTPSPAYSITLFGANGQSAAATGGGVAMVPGQVIARTSGNGSIHQHNFFFLDDNADGTNNTLPAQGIYLIAMRLRIGALQPSDPFYMLWATPGVTSAALNGVAEPWVNANFASLSQLVVMNNGDFNHDGFVNAADYTVWRDTAGSIQVLAADGDGTRLVDGADYTLWSNNYVASGATGTAVPEPASALAALLAIAAWGGRRRMQ